MSELEPHVRTPVVLITDDEPLIRNYLSVLIDDIAIVETATDGDDALRKISENPPDLVLLDVEMSGRGGYEICEELKADPSTAAIPVIFITGHDDVDDEERGLVIGGADYIKKPLSPGLVKARINNQLRLLKYQRELERLATTDQLTDLWNRRHLFDVAANELGRFKRYGHPFSVVLFDIDHFKKLNDTRGHAVGDIALKESARVLSETVRREDTLARIGGEEFCVILPDTKLKGARTMAENMRQRIEAASFNVDGPEVRITISLGATEVRADDEKFEATLERADQALYAAKNGGRNRVEALT